MSPHLYYFVFSIQITKLLLCILQNVTFVQLKNCSYNIYELIVQCNPKGLFPNNQNAHLHILDAYYECL